MFFSSTVAAKGAPFNYVASIVPDLPLAQCSIRVDAALYEGKRSGKNKVVQWTAA